MSIRLLVLLALLLPGLAHARKDPDDGWRDAIDKALDPNGPEPWMLYAGVAMGVGTPLAPLWAPVANFGLDGTLLGPRRGERWTTFALRFRLDVHLLNFKDPVAAGLGLAPTFAAGFPGGFFLLSLGPTHPIPWSPIGGELAVSMGWETKFDDFICWEVRFASAPLIPRVLETFWPFDTEPLVTSTVPMFMLIGGVVFRFDEAGMRPTPVGSGYRRGRSNF